jgi:hypothetical protein
MIRNFEQATKFADWMIKIKSIHYSNPQKMLKAFQRIEPLTADRAIINFKIAGK